MGFWGFVALLAIALLMFVRWMKRRQGNEAGRSGAAQGSGQWQDLGTALRAAHDAMESDWLRPEPSGAVRSGDTRGQTASAGTASQRARPAAAAKPIDEDTTVVMRKQLPPRDEPPRSWLGGLPMLPPSVEWPRGINPEDKDKGAVPLHFIAQIACADLPAELWGGLGPRDGWLLFFVNNNHCDLSDSGVTRILHTAELGLERMPPTELGVIHDGIYTGARSWTERERLFPRFPVDLVSMPNRLYEHDRHLRATPDNLADLLYEGLSIGENVPHRVKIEPLSWRCLSLAADMALARLDDSRDAANRARHHHEMRAKISEPRAIEGIVSRMEARELEMRSNPTNRELLEADIASLDDNQRIARARLEANTHQIDETRSFLAQHSTAADLLDYIERENEQHWLAMLRSGLVALCELAEQRGLDTPLSAEEWREVQAELAKSDKTIWSVGFDRWEAGQVSITLTKRALSAFEFFARSLSVACADVAKECYIDATRRELIPEETREALAASYRAIYDNRPHRMGGYHDGVQTSVEERPTNRVLLMQFSCDYTMEWLWGDCGAVYAFIDPDDLKAHRFDEAQIHLECH